MFGFLIKNEVGDDAVRLKTLADMAAHKYCMRSFAETCAAVRTDVDGQKCHTQGRSCWFVHQELPEFAFDVEEVTRDRPLALTASGRGKYAGFMLQTIDGGQSWHISVSDGPLFRATGGARKLAQIMERKFDVMNMTKFLKSAGITQ